MVDARQLHELYGTTNRRRHFPEAQWHHLVLAARNMAAAFDTMHAAGIVVGDVNQGNLLVDNADVRAVHRLRFVPDQQRRQDISLPGRHAPLHAARVAIARNCATSRRTVDHDRFGLAMLDLPSAVRGPASLCRPVPRRGRPADREGDRPAPVCLFPGSGGHAGRAAAIFSAIG